MFSIENSHTLRSDFDAIGSSRSIVTRILKKTFQPRPRPETYNITHSHKVYMRIAEVLKLAIWCWHKCSLSLCM